MKYSLTNTINKPLAEVAEKFGDPDGIKHWMEGLQKIERVSGTPGKTGAKSNFHFLHKNREMVISETILEENLPNQMKFSYDSAMGRNIVEICFESISDKEVKQTSNTTMELKGGMKIMGFLFKGMFKKQSLKYMTAFKEYAEK